MRRFSDTVEQVLIGAGWFHGRNVGSLVSQWEEELRLSDNFEMFATAERALSEFGGLFVNQEGPGETCSREPFRIDPTLAIHEADRFAEFADFLKMKLYPLGEAFGGHGFLAIAENGQVVLLMQDIQSLGESIEEALEHLVLGVKPVFLIELHP